MDLIKNVDIDELVDAKFRITWPCFTDNENGEKKQKANNDDDDDDVKPSKKDKKSKKKRKKKKKSLPPPTPLCSVCRRGPAGAARTSVRRAALWCCARCCLMCCSALRVLVAMVGVVGICLAAFYILAPNVNKEGGARVMRAGLRALGARPRAAPLRARGRSPPAGTPGEPRVRSATTELDTLQRVTTECGADCPGGKTGCPGGRPDCPGGGPDGGDCGPGCPGSKASCLAPTEGMSASPDLQVVAGPFQVVDASVIVSPHDDTAALDEPAEDSSCAVTPDDQGPPDGTSSPGDLEGQSGPDVSNDPED